MDQQSLLKLLIRAEDSIRAAQGSIASKGYTPAAETAIRAAQSVLGYIVTKQALTTVPAEEPHHQPAHAHHG